jgi:hypothetical protein
MLNLVFQRLIDEIAEEMKRRPWIAGSVLTFWILIWAGGSYGYFKLLPAVENSANVAMKVDRIELNLIEERLYTARRDQCTADAGTELRAFYEEKIRSLEYQYRQLTSSPYRLSDCTVFQ